MELRPLRKTAPHPVGLTERTCYRATQFILKRVKTFILTSLKLDKSNFF